MPGGTARMIPAPGDSQVSSDLHFWQPPVEADRRRATEDLVEAVLGLVETAVERAAPKRGAAVSLSGGMDSSSVWGTLIQQAEAEGLRRGAFRPYSNVYPGLPCDETPYIRSIHEFTGVEGVLIDTSKTPKVWASIF